MALNSEKLIETLDLKATEYIGEAYTTNSTDIKEKLFKVIAESVIEHFQQYAEIKVLIVGTDAGAAVSDYTDRFTERGDSPITDAGLVAAVGSVIASGNIAASIVLSNSGFID